MEWPSGCEVDSKVFGEFELEVEGSFLGIGKHFLGDPHRGLLAKTFPVEENKKICIELNQLLPLSMTTRPHVRILITYYFFSPPQHTHNKHTRAHT